MTPNPFDFCKVESNGEGWDVLVYAYGGSPYVVEAVSDREDADSVATAIRRAFASWNAQAVIDLAND